MARALAKDSAWVRNHENIFVLGPTGVGKSFIASALAQKACRDGHSALYLRAAALLRELALARADGSLRILVTHPIARAAHIAAEKNLSGADARHLLFALRSARACSLSLLGQTADQEPRFGIRIVWRLVPTARLKVKTEQMHKSLSRRPECLALIGGLSRG